jgi:hypothetical protein
VVGVGCPSFGTQTQSGEPNKKGRGFKDHTAPNGEISYLFFSIVLTLPSVGDQQNLHFTRHREINQP